MAATRDAAPSAFSAEETKAPYEKLSPGPGMAPSDVGAHQRARFYKAMTEVVAERGYAHVAVRDLVDRAKVSSRAFYEQFHGKEDCFLRTHELVVRRTAKRIVTAGAGERDWRERLRLGFKALIREVEREPQAARLVLVDAYLDGPLARAEARKAELLFSAMLADLFTRDPDGPSGSSIVVEAIVAGVVEVARRHVLSGRKRASQRLADELVDWALACRERAAEPVAQSLSIPSRESVKTGSPPGTSDRDLSLAAVAKLAATEGYASLTVPRIRAAAGISRQRFDAEFEGVDDCLSAAREKSLGEALLDAEYARDSAPKNAGASAAALVLCSRFADDPTLAHLCFAIDCVGPRDFGEGRASFQAEIDRVAAALYGSKIANRPSIAVQASVGLVWTMIGTRAPSRPPDALHRVAKLLTALV
jgi:AcrR family transcriptional regulator